MKTKRITTALLFAMFLTQAFCQNSDQPTKIHVKDSVPDYKFSVSTTYHIGYHIPLFKNRMYIELQIHCNYWPIDTKAPQSFQVEESKWNNYVLFEPNLYIGVNF